MYAIIETGGKQYTVSQGDQVKVEKLDGNIGDAVDFERVVAVSDEDGVLHVGSEASGTVAATISGHGRRKKIEVLKFKRRKMYRRRMGHRQSYTEIRIDSILGQAKPEADAPQMVDSAAVNEGMQGQPTERGSLPEAPPQRQSAIPEDMSESTDEIESEQPVTPPGVSTTSSGAGELSAGLEAAEPRGEDPGERQLNSDEESVAETMDRRETD